MKTVFVCEPNVVLRKEIIHTLEKEGFSCLGDGNDGQECLNFIAQNPVDLLVFDVMISTIDGYALLECIKEFQIKPKMIVLSSFIQEDFIAKALSLGADYLMLKPVTMNILSKRAKGLFEENHITKISSLTREIDEKIANIFITVGIPAHIKGYQYLREGIKLAIRQPEIINSITKRLYPEIATIFGTSASKVERAIRHAIEVAWNRGKIENLNEVFHLKIYTANEKPTNGEFIALVADKLLIRG